MPAPLDSPTPTAPSPVDPPHASGPADGRAVGACHMDASPRARYPFAAVVGQERMKTALLLTVVDPTMGGVLIRGDKGTGKSTVARALADRLPPLASSSEPTAPREDSGDHAASWMRGAMPFVDLPLGATEDRLIGALHVEASLSRGERVFEPGLLAAADGGILYVDEVNLLEDHLVDALLDVVASGVNVIEREGIRHSHPARFVLIGTMNPEEGELRPQFLDRFGLCVTVSGLDGEADRLEVIRRRLAYEADPEAFASAWREEDALIATQVETARAALARVTIPDEAAALAVRLAHRAEAKGHRAELAMIKAARALAALLEAEAVAAAHVLEAARYVLPHRLRQSPLDSLEQVDERVEAVIAGAASRPDVADQPERAEGDLVLFDDMQVPGNLAAGGAVFELLKKKRTTPSTSPRTPAPSSIST